MGAIDTAQPVKARPVKAAPDCFLTDDYHRVITRLIAGKAGANVSMIRETLNPFLAVTSGAAA